MSRNLIIAALLLLPGAMPAFAQDAPAPAQAPARASAAVERAQDDAKVDRLCLRETGSHIRVRADRAKPGRGCPSSLAGRVYTQQDLRSTGAVDIADALRMLDPSLR